MKVRLIILCLLFAVGNVFGQVKSEQFIENLIGNWVSTESVNHTVIIKRDKNILLITETTAEETGKPYVIESKIYLDGRLQKDGLKQSATEARTVVSNSNLITTYYGLKDGKTKELFKERLSIKDGNLILAAQVKIGVPFLAAGTKQVFQKSTNQ